VGFICRSTRVVTRTRPLGRRIRSPDWRACCKSSRLKPCPESAHSWSARQRVGTRSARGIATSRSGRCSRARGDFAAGLTYPSRIARRAGSKSTRPPRTTASSTATGRVQQVSMGPVIQSGKLWAPNRVGRRPTGRRPARSRRSKPAKARFVGGPTPVPCHQPGR